MPLCRILEFDQNDAARLARDAAFNDLESTVYKLRDLISDDSFTAAATSDVITSLTNLIEETSTWLYDSEGGDIARGDEIKAKLKALVDIAEPIRIRMEEHKRRPEQVQLVRDALDQTKQLATLMEETVKAEEMNRERKKKEREEAAAAAASATPDGFEDLEDKDTSASTEPETPKDEIIPPLSYDPEDIVSLNALITEVTRYLDEKLIAQDKLPLNVDPVVTIKELEGKIKACNEMVMQVMTKQLRVQEERERKEKLENAKKEKEKKKKEKEEREREKKEKEAKKEEEKKEEGEEKKEKKDKHDEL